MPTINDLVLAAEGGDGAAAKALFGALYDELHVLAEHHLRRGPEVTLGTTTLLHEAYLKLAQRDGPVFPDRGRFLAYASKAMRGLVIDYARARRAQKRGGAFELVRLDGDEPAAGSPTEVQLERLTESIEELEALEPALAQLVDFHFFAGFSFGEIAALQQISERTVQRNWRKARMLLQRLMAPA